MLFAISDNWLYLFLIVLRNSLKWTLLQKRSFKPWEFWSDDKVLRSPFGIILCLLHFQRNLIWHFTSSYYFKFPNKRLISVCACSRQNLHVWFACWLKLDFSIASYKKEQFWNPMYFAFINISVLSGTFIKIIQLAFGFSSCTQCLLIWKSRTLPIYKIHNGRAYALALVGLGLF